MMDEGTLARREHENMVEAFAQVCGSVPGSLIRREGGVALIATGLPVRLFNQVLIEDDDADERALERAVETTRARGDRFVVHLRVSTDRRHLPTLMRLGLVASEDGGMPGMALHPVPPAPLAVAPGHEIRRVTTPEGVEDHIAVAIEGFEMPEAFARAIVPVSLLERPAFAVYVGYTGGVPVTAGLGIRSGDTIGVYNIATIPSYRRRGYGAAMTTRIAADGVAAGCDVAILQASEMGFPIYEALGYRTVVEYRGFVDPAVAALDPEGDAGPGAVA